MTRLTSAAMVLATVLLAAQAQTAKEVEASLTKQLSGGAGTAIPGRSGKGHHRQSMKSRLRETPGSARAAKKHPSGVQTVSSPPPANP